jgi:hypothetical protein
MKEEEEISIITAAAAAAAALFSNNQRRRQRIESSAQLAGATHHPTTRSSTKSSGVAGAVTALLHDTPRLFAHEHGRTRAASSPSVSRCTTTIAAARWQISKRELPGLCAHVDPLSHKREAFASLVLSLEVCARMRVPCKQQQKMTQ